MVCSCVCPFLAIFPNDMPKLSDCPVAPINVTAVVTGVGSLLVSWSLANSEEVVENFTLTATNLNNTNISSITVPGITGQNHTLSIEDTTSCDVYAFRVTAWNDVGSSPPSETITSIFPPLPDLSTVTLQHSLRKISQGSVEITVTFSLRMEVQYINNSNQCIMILIVLRLSQYLHISCGGWFYF